VTVNDNIFALGVDEGGQVVYSRKDPNRRGTDLGEDDHWLEPDHRIDNTAPGRFGAFDVLTFNNDIYLAGWQSASRSPAGVYLVNFSRAAIKKIVVEERSIETFWGPGADGAVRTWAYGTDPSVAEAFFSSSTDVASVGDFNGDGWDDLLRFSPASGEAKVGVSDGRVLYRDYRTWKSGFVAPRGLIPLVGDFDGDSDDDIIGLQPAIVSGDIVVLGRAYVARSDRSRFGATEDWGNVLFAESSVPRAGKFDANASDDIAVVVQPEPFDETDEAGVWLFPASAGRFEEGRRVLPVFSFRGETVLTGNFDGEGGDDLLTTLFGRAVYVVALSSGAGFDTPARWADTEVFDSREVLVAGDVNFDGKDDVVRFVPESGGTVPDRWAVYVHHSRGDRFDPPTLLVNRFATQGRIPVGSSQFAVGYFRRERLADITGLPADRERRCPCLVGLSPATDSISRADVMAGAIPFPSGAPWERYGTFTRKGLGVLMFPEWLTTADCLPDDVSFYVGSAGGAFFPPLSIGISMRHGSGIEHVLEELGHAFFSGCFRAGAPHAPTIPGSSPPITYRESIFDIPWEEGGFGAGQIADVCIENSPDDFYDCRRSDPFKAEHIFLQLMIKYRVYPELFRDRIRTEPNPLYRAHLAAAYDWLRKYWFDELEFRTGEFANGSRRQVGLPVTSLSGGEATFLRGDCNGDGEVTGLVTDAVFLLTFNFLGGPEPPCRAACDSNGDGQFAGQVTDAVYILSHNFLGGPPPPAPFPGCGVGTSRDLLLGCANPGCK
jgi:hypothetical protein